MSDILEHKSYPRFIDERLAVSFATCIIVLSEVATAEVVKANLFESLRLIGNAQHNFRASCLSGR